MILNTLGGEKTTKVNVKTALKLTLLNETLQHTVQH